ncbi:MAG: SGNH/GDSL hydrolase family protein [Candidatus Kaistia colombiensis]|nr:MAG: SGNH/GDSL hydrolase family protein [Kaistia sp.]
MALRTIVIGGSNTVMQPGYWPTLLARMAQRGMPLEVVADLSVGGTTSGFGLFQLKANDHHLAEADVLIIEYALNDAFVYGDERRPFRHWARFYEGVIRHALARNPKLHIVSLVFGQRGGAYISSVPSIDAGMHYISDWYDTAIVDVSRHLMRRFGRDVVTDPSFYADQGHYARPIATTLVADIIAEDLERILAAPFRPRGVPPPIDPHHFADAKIIDAKTLIETCGLPARVYSNRRFAATTADLGAFRLKLDFDRGRPLAMAYVCAPDISALEIAMAGETVEAAMLKGGVRDGAFKFLLSMLSCDFLYPGPALLQEPATFSCSIQASRSVPGVARHVPKDNVAHPESDGSAARVMPLLGMLYTGTLKSCVAEPIADLRLQPATATERVEAPSN